jgi:hypothetical protein
VHEPLGRHHPWGFATQMISVGEWGKSMVLEDRADSSNSSYWCSSRANAWINAWEGGVRDGDENCCDYDCVLEEGSTVWEGRVLC